MHIRILLSLITPLLMGCSSAPAAVATFSASPTSTETLAPIMTAATAVPTTGPINTPERLMLWLPEPLNPVGNETTNTLLAAQIAAFENANPTVDVEWRLKQVENVGGIMSTLRTASSVAPGVLPDLTLIRREDLVLAVDLGLAQSFDERASSAILGDLYGAALRLGLVEGELYGLPYLLEVQHLAYRPPLVLEGWSFVDVLARDVPFVFPAARASGVNDVFLVQYLSALPTQDAALIGNGELPIDAEALRTVLAFYEQALERSIVTASLLDFNTPIDYAAYVGEGAVLVTSTTYLTSVIHGDRLEFAPIPTLSGTDVTMLDGWMWVMTTTNAERQVLALEFIDWMMDAQRHGDYGAAVHMVPSQRTTLRLWENADYRDFVDQLLTNAYLPLSESAATNARALQNALASVLLGQRTAEEATQDVLEQLSG